MDSNQQPNRLSPWSATFHERRTALFIAIVCIVLIGAAMLAPQWFKSKDQAAVTPAESTQDSSPVKPKSSDKPTFRISEAPAIAPVTAETPVNPPSAAPPEPKPAPKAVASTPPQQKPALTPSAKVEPTKKPVTTRTAPVATRTPAGYYVQVGAFKDKAHASQLRKKLNANGFNCRLVDRGNGLLGVWIGPEANRPAAEKLQQELKTRMHMQGFVAHSG